jgi:hypothetical protein
MGMVRFLAAILFFLALGIQGLLPAKAYASCCGCVCMWWACTCAGQVDPVSHKLCGYCRSADPVMQTNASLDKNAEQQPINGSVQFVAAKSDIIQLVMDMRMGQPCFRNKIALSLLGDTREVLKFQPIHFEGIKGQDQPLAF